MLINSDSRTVLNAVLRWFDEHGRSDLPWQQNINPPSLDIRDLLKQTQVTTVIPYYKRFIGRFLTSTRCALLPR